MKKCICWCLSNFMKICFSDPQWHLCSLCFQKLSVVVMWRQYFKRTVLPKKKTLWGIPSHRKKKVRNWNLYTLMILIICFRKKKIKKFDLHFMSGTFMIDTSQHLINSTSFFVLLISRNYIDILPGTVRECFLLFGTESFVFQFAIQKVKDQDI